MEKYFEILKKTHLFRGFSDEEMIPMLDCLSAKIIHFQKGESICLMDDSIKNIGIVVGGRLRVQKEEANGNVYILSDLNIGDLLGDELFFAGEHRMPFSVWAAAPSDMIFLNCEEIFKFCYLACTFHSKLIYNIVEMISQKLLLVNQKMDIIHKSTTREKVLAFLNLHAEKNKSPKFTIPFNRRELAEYLCVNRSALSNELSKLRNEGIIEFNKNSFHLR